MVSTCARNSFWILQKSQIKKPTRSTIYIYIYIKIICILVVDNVNEVRSKVLVRQWDQEDILEFVNSCKYRAQPNHELQSVLFRWRHLGGTTCNICTDDQWWSYMFILINALYVHVVTICLDLCNQLWRPECSMHAKKDGCNANKTS